MPKISVIIATYCVEKFIARAIDSILAQTFTDWELIIVNEFGSNDGTEEIVKSYKDSRIQFVQNTEKRLGLGVSRNEGIYIAQGKYVAFLDADDVSLPERLQIQYNSLEQNQDIGGCGSNSIIIEYQSTQISDYPISILECYYHLFFNAPSVPSTWMFRKSALDQYQCYFSDFKTLEDFEFITRFIQHSKFMNIKTPLVQYIRHEGVLSKKPHIMKQEFHDKAIIIKRMLDYYNVPYTDREIYLFMLGCKYRQLRVPGRIKENKRFFDKIYKYTTQVDGESSILKKILDDHLAWNTLYYDISFKKFFRKIKFLIKKILKKILTVILPTRLNQALNFLFYPETLTQIVTDQIYSQLSNDLIKPFVRERLKNMSIISENCKAVDMHKYFEVYPYKAPIMSLYVERGYDTYLEDIIYYSNLPIEFLDDVAPRPILDKNRPAGFLKGTNIKLIFNHNTVDEQEIIIQNWKRRVARLNLDDLLVFMPFSLIEKYKDKYKHIVVLDKENKIYLINKGVITVYDFRPRNIDENDYWYEHSKMMYIFENPMLLFIMLK